MDGALLARKIDRMDKFFHKNSVFCFTSDVDWAPESAIAKTIDVFKRLDLPATFFVTHQSKVISREFRGRNERVGVHPNFLHGSTHGDTIEDQVKTARELWPGAKAFRAHAYYDNTLVLRAMYASGFEYDSNSFEFMQPYISPLLHHTGLVRFPVFWEDDIHGEGHEFRLSEIRGNLEKPGLKVFNFHPLWVSLNIPSVESYRKNKFLAGAEHRADAVIDGRAFVGRGALTFLEEVAAYISKRKRSVALLNDLYEQVLQGFDDAR